MPLLRGRRSQGGSECIDDVMNYTNYFILQDACFCVSYLSVTDRLTAMPQLPRPLCFGLPTSSRSIIVSAATGPDAVMNDTLHILQMALIAGIPILFFVGTLQANARQDLCISRAI